MMATIDPDSWRDQGGHGAVSNIGGLLLIKQTQENQDRIENLLNKLNEMFAGR